MTARSIIIGVGETTWGDGVFPRLAGVSHDVEAMEYQLAKSGYKLPIVPTGTALQADCIAQSLGDLVSSTGPGDQLVIYLSGHGYEVADANDDDGDGWDEAFVCADRPILDDWFRDTLWREARPGARIVAVVDACHSRSIFKGAVGPPRITPTNQADRGYYRLIVSACADESVAKDMGDGKDRTAGGVLTRSMIALLGDGQHTYRSLGQELCMTHLESGYGSPYGSPTVESIGPDDQLLDSLAFRA